MGDELTLNLSTKIQWEIRQAYIKRLLELDVNPLWLQMELPILTNETMADLIKQLLKITPDNYKYTYNNKR